MFKVFTRSEGEGILMLWEGVEGVECSLDVWCELENDGISRRLLHALAPGGRSAARVCHFRVALEDLGEDTLEDVVPAVGTKLSD